MHLFSCREDRFRARKKVKHTPSALPSSPNQRPCPNTVCLANREYFYTFVIIVLSRAVENERGSGGNPRAVRHGNRSVGNSSQPILRVPFVVIFCANLSFMVFSTFDALSFRDEIQPRRLDLPPPLSLSHSLSLIFYRQRIKIYTIYLLFFCFFTGNGT